MKLMDGSWDGYVYHVLKPVHASPGGLLLVLVTALIILLLPKFKNKWAVWSTESASKQSAAKNCHSLDTFLFQRRRRLASNFQIWQRCISSNTRLVEQMHR